MLRLKFLVAFLLPLITTTAFTDRIDYHRQELDSFVRDIMWCGQDNDVILILTERGTLFRSRDRGISFKRLQSVLAQTGQAIADANQEVSLLILVLSVVNRLV